MNFKEYELSIGSGYTIADKRIKLQFPLKNSTRIMSYFLSHDTSNVLVVASEDEAKSSLQRFIMANIFKWYKPTSIRFKAITAAFDYEKTYFAGIPVTLAPHTLNVVSVMNTNSYESILFTLKNLRNDMQVIKELLNGIDNAAEYNNFGVAKIPHVVVFIDRLMEYVYTLNQAEIETVIKLLHDIMEMAGKVNYHIVMFETELQEKFTTLSLFDKFPYRIAMKSSPTSSRLLIGTDIACTLPAGSNAFYTQHNGEFLCHEVPYVSDELFGDIIRKCSMYC